MTSAGRTLAIVAASSIGLPVLALVSGWIWILFSSTPLDTPITAWVPWPVACTSRGCITTSAWRRQQAYGEAFSAATHTATPQLNESLTTLVRQHLTAHAFLRSPVTVADARRYRIDILHLKEPEQLAAALPISLSDYDTYVVLPYLQQEALKYERSITDSNTLYAQLSQERYIFILLPAMKWDTSKGVVVTR